MFEALQDSLKKLSHPANPLHGAPVAGSARPHDPIVWLSGMQKRGAAQASPLSHTAPSVVACGVHRRVWARQYVPARQGALAQLPPEATGATQVPMQQAVVHDAGWMQAA